MERMTAAPVPAPPATQPRLSPWAPLGLRVFRMLWLAVLASDIGTWMQTVGAQWMLVGVPNAATLVALVQTADTLPDVLLALPGGALADAFDRRRLLIWLQAFQVAIGIGLTVLTLTGQMSPALLLAFTFALGAASALATPAYQALIPELVPRHQLSSAAALGGISVNLARAIGPAVAGFLIARVGVGAVFALNTAAFLLFAVVLIGWCRPAVEGGAAPEAFIPALRAGGRYVRYSPAVRRILLHLGLFIAPATAIWALLPLVATRQLGFGPSGYGLLLGALGAGALIGAFAMASVRAIDRQGRVLVVSGLVFCAALAAFVLCPLFWPGVALLVVVGIAATVFSTMIATMIQLRVPGELRGRVMSLYSITLIGLPSLGALGVAALADTLGEGRSSAWSRPLMGLLDLLGVNTLTSSLGAAAGAPRAILLGALALLLVLALTAPLFLRAGTAASAQ